jgi:hypothetical protein
MNCDAPAPEDPVCFAVEPDEAADDADKAVVEEVPLAEEVELEPQAADAEAGMVTPTVVQRPLANEMVSGQRVSIVRSLLQGECSSIGRGTYCSGRPMNTHQQHSKPVFGSSCWKSRCT